MELTDYINPIIRYIVMLGRRTKPNPIAVLPPVCMSHNLLQHISSIPHNLYHFLAGCDYFQRVLLSGEQSGIQVDFVFNDTIDDERFIMSLSGGLNIFLICTDNEEELIEMNISLSRICPKNCLFWVDNSVKDKFVMPRVITEQEKFWDYLFKYVLAAKSRHEKFFSLILNFESRHRNIFSSIWFYKSRHFSTFFWDFIFKS